MHSVPGLDPPVSDNGSLSSVPGLDPPGTWPVFGPPDYKSHPSARPNPRDAPFRLQGTFRLNADTLSSVNLARRDGELYYLENFIPTAEADRFLERLRAELDWREEVVTIAGRAIQVPRLVCWHGDSEARYRYSGVVHAPEPWTEALSSLRQRVEAYCAQRFNSVLGNLYRNGDDTLGWHADQERELGPEPYIASLSFGAERRFDLRHNRSRETMNLPLTHGSLLLMGGQLQHHWQHRIPRMRGVRAPRINLTFRAILPSPIRKP